MIKLREHAIHILHVVPGLGPGGMELGTAQIIRGLTDANMKHSVVCLKGTADIADRLPPETDIYCFHALPNQLMLPWRLAKLVRHIHPDVIHSRNWGAWPDMALARLMATWPPRPFIFSFHGLGKAGYMPYRRRLASKVLVHFTPFLFAVSRQSRDLMVHQWGWPAERTEVIPNGVDTSRFFPEPQLRVQQRVVVGSVGNLRTVKNHALILNACARLLRDGLELEIRIAGEGDQRQVLLKLAGDLGISSRLFLPGSIADVPNFLNGLDVFVLSSDSEQHPNALNEAMACGVASIGTRVGCVEDLLDSGRCGLIIEPGDVDGLAMAIRDLALDHQRRRHFADAGLQQVKTVYNLEVMLERYRNLYLRAANCDADPN